MLEGFLEGLQQPEYIHVLINPLPIYGLASGLIALVVGLALRSRKARLTAYIVLFIAAASAWPVSHYGQNGYDRIKSMSDSEGQKWLEEHMRRAERLVYAFYGVGTIALVSIGAECKRLKASIPLAITTLALGTTALGVGGYISYAGGHIRHKEFRFEPAPALRTEERHAH
jgi:hypothetical protein